MRKFVHTLTSKIHAVYGCDSLLSPWLQLVKFPFPMKTFADPTHQTVHIELLTKPTQNTGHVTRHCHNRNKTC